MARGITGGDRWLALLATLALHALALWWLWQPRDPGEPRRDDSALQVVWIERAPDPPPLPEARQPVATTTPAEAPANARRPASPTATSMRSLVTSVPARTSTATG